MTLCAIHEDAERWRAAVAQRARMLAMGDLSRDEAAYLSGMLTAMWRADATLRLPLTGALTRLRAAARRLG